MFHSTCTAAAAARRGGGSWSRGAVRRRLGRRAASASGGGGAARRMFDGGELRLVLLKLIADEPRHGYDLIRAIEELTGGAYAPSPGVVYPTLTMLDEMGLIEEQRVRGRARSASRSPTTGAAHLAEQRGAGRRADRAADRARRASAQRTDGAPDPARDGQSAAWRCRSGWRAATSPRTRCTTSPR